MAAMGRDGSDLLPSGCRVPIDRRIVLNLVYERRFRGTCERFVLGFITIHRAFFDPAYVFGMVVVRKKTITFLGH